MARFLILCAFCIAISSGDAPAPDTLQKMVDAIKAGTFNNK